MDPTNPHELLVCPYDPVHILYRKRMDYHIVKCRKNHNPSDFKTCPFNAQHVVPAPELNYHQSICPDRARMDAEVYHETHQYKQKGDTSLPLCDWTPPQAAESWDEDNIVYEPKLMEELFEEEKKKPVLTKKNTKAPAPPEPLRTPHSLPMAGLKALAASGVSQGRGRGRGITRKLLETKSFPSGLKQKQDGEGTATVLSSNKGMDAPPEGVQPLHDGVQSLSKVPPILSNTTVMQYGGTSLVQSGPVSQETPPPLGPAGGEGGVNHIPTLGQDMAGLSLMSTQIPPDQGGGYYGGKLPPGFNGVPPPPGLGHNLDPSSQSSLQPVPVAMGGTGGQMFPVVPTPQLQQQFVPLASWQNQLGLSRGFGRGRGFPAGFGRGVMLSGGLGSGVSAPGVAASQSPTNGEESAPLEKEEEETQGEEEEDVKRKKTIRKLRKTLRQVEEIETKKEKGAKLTPEQIAKLNRKDDLLQKLLLIENGESEGIL